MSHPLVLVLLLQAGRLLGDEIQLELVTQRKIWDQAPHNAFTDLARHGGRWLCVFREGSGHIPGSDGKIRVIASDTGETWRSLALVERTGIDLRDPKLSVTPDGRLMLLMGGSTYDGVESPKDRTFLKARTHVSFSHDGVTWTSPQPVSIENEWAWRITWHQKTGYIMAYAFYAGQKEFHATLWKTSDGIHYEKVFRPSLPEGSMPDETTLRFLSDGTMVALVRGEQRNRHAYIGSSKPPYTSWQWHEAKHSAGGPNFVTIDDKTWVYGGRDYPDEARTVLGRMTPTGLQPLLVLPSGGDTSYPGLVYHDGLLWVSYYASHEGKTSIYLAKVAIRRKP